MVINLDRHQDRLEWFNHQAQDAGIIVKRLNAIDANNSDFSAEIETHRAAGALLSRAELACILSHRNAWKLLVNSEHSHLAVFEDDVYLSKDMHQILALDFVALKIDLLKLEAPTGKVCVREKAEAVVGNRKIHTLLTKAYGAGGYVVSRACAKRLLELSQRCTEPVDAILFDNKPPLSDEYVVSQLIPAACIQDCIVAIMRGKQGRFESAIASASAEDQRKRKAENKKNRRPISFKTFFQYLHCIRGGARLFGQKQHIPFDLDGHGL